MAVPKKKTSPSRRGMRNAHVRVTSLSHGECQNCGVLKLTHHVCTTCGFYNGTKVMITKNDKKASKVQTESE